MSYNNNQNQNYGYNPANQQYSPRPGYQQGNNHNTASPRPPSTSPGYYQNSPPNRPPPGYAPQNYQPPPPQQGYPPSQQGYPPQTSSRGPPPGADPQLWGWFISVDTDGSGQLSVDELQRALVNGDWSPFNVETVRMMVNMFDTDNTGTIDFNEFAGLWKYIEQWKRCFQQFDADGSGSIDSSELKTALSAFGYNLSDKTIRMLIQKFDKYGRGDVTFDNFVQACVTIKTLTDSFRVFDTDNDGYIQIGYEQFLELVVKQR